MGALEFAPVMGPAAHTSAHIDVARLVDLASEILTHHTTLRASFNEGNNENSLRDILHVGTSAGGARAKAVIAWNPITIEVRSGQVNVGEGFEHWLLKFDGVSGNKDKELDDPKGYGLIEYAYYLMARDCGIDISECRLFKENGRSHFMTRRFDRTSTGERLHMQSLCALGHFDFHMPGAHSYEQAMLMMRQMNLPMQSIEQLFRRMAFNIIARNQDDHVKNIAFLMNQSGEWSLSPAFDVTYSFNPDGLWTSSHQMTLNGKRDRFTMDDFEACARSVSMKRGRAKAIVAEVHETVSMWPSYAEQAGVPDHLRTKVHGAPNLMLMT